MVGGSFINQKRWGEESSSFQNCYQAKSNGWRTGQGYAIYQKGRLELGKGNHEGAIRSFSWILESNQMMKICLPALSYCELCLRLLRNRDSALADYRAALGLPNVKTPIKRLSNS
jgi:hypothetical protein